MRLRTFLAAAAVSSLTAGLVGVPAHSATPTPPAQAGSVVTWGDENPPASGVDAIPVPVSLTAPVRSVAANDFATGVVTLDGAIKVWGNATKGEVGLAPSDITDATAITLGTNNGAALHADGTITAWGETTALQNIPTDLRATSIALQFNTGYAVRPNGTLAVWGDAPSYAAPTDLTNLVDVSSNSALHALALRADGTVVTWGNSFLPDLVTVPDFGGKKAVKIATGPGYSGAVLEDGTMRIWGPDFQLPAGAPEFDGETPAETVVDISLGNGTAAAVTADGIVHAWGSNAPVKAVPASLAGEPVSAVAVGATHAAAVITAFRELTKPSISGQPTVGQTLTATPATFSLTPESAAGQWYAGVAPIAGQTATSLVLGTALLGKSITYRTTASRDGDTVTSDSAAVGPVAAVITPKPPKADSKVTAKVKASGKSKKLAKKVTVAVTVKTIPGVSPAGKVTLTLKGKTKKKVTVKVNARGKATATFKRIKRGKYTVTLTYAGNAQVKSASSKVKFKA